MTQTATGPEPEEPATPTSAEDASRLRVFKNRNFRLLWTGAVASNVGTWMTAIAQGWLIITLTNSPGWLGAVALTNSIPFLVLPLFGGVIADRVDRVRLLKLTQAFSMLLSFSMAALTLSGLVQIWQILIIGLLNSTAASFDQPTRNALLPDLVPHNQLMQAVSLNSTAYQGAALVGPSIAGVLVDVIGTGGCFVIDGFSYLFVILALFMMRVPASAPQPSRPVMSDMREGLAFLRRTPVLWSVLLMTCVFSLFGRSYSTLLPAFARLVLHRGSSSLGLMYAMPGLGTLVGGFALAAYGDVRRKGTFLTAIAILTGVVLIAFSFTPTLWLLLPLLIAVGVGITTFNATVSTVMQTRSPGAMRGRVMSYFTMVWRGLTPMGGSLAGLMAEFLGTRESILIGAVAVIIAALALYLLVPHVREADRELEAAAAAAS